MSAVDSNASILSVRHYSVTPPNNLVIPVEEVIPQSREEEIITKKKTELTTTRQIQTRVKRQVVLEDGKIVEDSGPIVTTNTTEDTEKHEEQNTEHRNLGDGESKLLDELDNGNVSVVKRVNEKKVKSREEKEERLETEQVAHLGDISDDLYLKAVQSNQTRQLGRLASSSLVPTSSAPRIVHQSSKVKKVTDTEDTKHVSQLADGKLLTQSETTVEHEEVNDLQEPCEEDIEDHESVHESSHHYRKTKDQDLVEYLENGVKIGEKVKFSAENFTGAGTGNPDCLNLEPALKWETLSERIRKLKKNASPTPGTHNPQTASPLAGERSDAITQSPVDIVQEEQSRRVETSKWLDNHFGSESSASSSKNSTGITEWKSSIPELSADIKDNTSTTQEWKTETDTSSEWRKLSQSKNTSLLSDGSEVKKSSVEEHTRVNRVIPIQLYRTNSSSDLPKNQVMYKPDIPSGGSLSSLPIYAEVNKKKTRFAPDPTPISRNPDPIQSDLSLQDRSKSDFYNRKIGGSAYNLNLAPNQEMGSTNGNAGGGASVKRRNSTKRASLTESFKKFVDKLRHGGKKRNSTSNNGGGQNSPDQLDRTQNSEPIVPPRSKHKNRTRKYYLGEDPYGSMYGKEKEYDSVTVYRDRPKNSGGTLPRRSSHHSNGGSDTHFDTVTVYKRKDPNSIGINRGGVQTLPRKSSLQTNPRGEHKGGYTRSIKQRCMLLTQSETTVEHEEVNDLQEPCEEDIEDHESVHESSHHYRKTKDQDLVEYLENGVKIGEKVKFSAENFTGAGTGNPDCLNLEPALKWETLSERIRKLKKNASPTPGTHNPQTASPLAGERSDAITQSPVDIVQEEQSRRVETSKWLDNHFGSESSASSSKNSTDNGPTSSRTTSFINVTMKSAPPTKSVSPTKLIVTPTETTILPSQASSPFYRGITEWKSSIPELSADIKDNTSTTQEWKTETDTSSEWRKLSQSKNTSLLSDGSEVKKSSVEEHTRVNRVIPIQLYRTNSSSDLPKNQVMYKPDIPSGGSLSSLPIYAEVNKKKTRFAPDPTPISRNPDPIQSDLSLQDRSKSDFYNRKIGGSAYNLNLAPNQEMGSTNGNAGGGASVKRRNSTKRASLTESFKKFVDKLRHGGKKRNSTSNNGGGQNSPDQLDRTQNSEPIVPPRSKHKNRTRKYYLGEDPYGSMYGKEKEYDSVTVYRDRPKNSGGTLPRRSSHHSNGGSDTHFDTVTVYKRKDPNSIGNNRGGVQTLPRKSSLQTNPRGDDTSDYETVTVYRSRGNSGSELRGDRGGIQTLPRKNKVKDIDQLSTTSNNSNINVFIVNKRSSQPFFSIIINAFTSIKLLTRSLPSV
ncbi:uncharacterized protein LOC103512184 [Diaphorina citri]|uniref:Uncharacterized protein LOC103512184 n=2 Tax=Diaphorina citri TaxID=121845 RepID=A0A3Q0J4A1_DIACI|nr:uncharacterized protein LOC103512184 [Diaphorina citri]